MTSLGHVSLEAWAKASNIESSILKKGHRSWEYSTLLDIAKVLSKEDATSLYSHQQFMRLPFSPHQRIRFLFWEDHSGCKVKSELGGGREVCKGGPGTWRAKRQASQASSAPDWWWRTSWMALCCLFPFSLWSSGWQEQNYLLLNQIANYVGNRTAVLCRKLLFIFYLTKVKAERVLHGALLWF